ncbi:hypothetical protein [Sphingobacterium thermophilum]|uniref:Uncharacterized protein n=1 Tax=Sphingobacterium thermophilum TaxID=768534 RepID=A0ABP8R411_9SPHI
MKKIFLIVLAATALTSCSTIKSGTLKSMDIIGPGVIHVPVLADLEVQPNKQQLTRTYTKVITMEMAKNNVIRDLIKQHNADVLIEPTFESETKSGATTITVKGWPATYKNFRQITKEDVAILEVAPHYLQKATSVVVSEHEGTKKRKR